MTPSPIDANVVVVVGFLGVLRFLALASYLSPALFRFLSLALSRSLSLSLARSLLLLLVVPFVLSSFNARLALFLNEA